MLPCLQESTWLSAIEKQKLSPVFPFFSHKLHYFLDYYNYLDASAVIFTLLIIPTRVAGSDYQWIFAALGYLFNGLRAFKYAAVFRWVIIQPHLVGSDWSLYNGAHFLPISLTISTLSSLDPQEHMYRSSTRSWFATSSSLGQYSWCFWCPFQVPYILLFVVKWDPVIHHFSPQTLKMFHCEMKAMQPGAQKMETLVPV